MVEKKIFSLNGRDYTIVKGARWYVEYYVQRTADVKERKRCYGQINRVKRLSDREQRAVELIRRLDSEVEHSEKESGSQTVNGVLTAFKNTFKKKTFSTYKTKVKYFELWLNGRDARLLTVKEANEFLLFIKAKGLHDTSVLAYKMTLSTLYEKMGVAVNPFKEAIKFKKRSTSLLYFSNQQINSLKKHFSKGDPQIWVSIQLEFYCFIRPGEIRLLEIPDIDISERWILVREEISKNGKSQKVRIPESFLAYLKKYIKQRGNKNGYVISKDPGGLVPVSTKYLNNNHAEGLRACGIKGRYAFYSWKHTGAVKAVKAGINLKDLQLQLRHHSLDQVNEYLKDLGVLDSRELREKFPAI